MAPSLQVPLQARVTGRAKPGRRKCPRRQPFHFLFSPRSHAVGAFPGLDSFPGFLSFFFFFFLTFPLTIYHKTDFGQKVSCTPPGVQGAILHIWDISKLPHSLCPSSSFYPPNILKPMRTFAVFHIMPPLQTLVALPMLSLLPHSILVQCRLSLL